MNRLIIVIFLFIISFHSQAQTYIPADKGSKVHFTIKNFGIATGGDLSNLKGQIVFNPQNPASSSFEVSVDVSTIDTDSENRDEHLKEDNYFYAEKYPVILIKSTKITTTNNTRPGWYYFTGYLTMRGITKEITFPFTAIQQGNDYLFAGEFELNRLDYSIGEPSAVMSKTVKVSLSVLARKS